METSVFRIHPFIWNIVNINNAPAPEISRTKRYLVSICRMLPEGTDRIKDLQILLSSFSNNPCSNIPDIKMFIMVDNAFPAFKIRCCKVGYQREQRSYNYYWNHNKKLFFVDKKFSVNHPDHGISLLFSIFTDAKKHNANVTKTTIIIIGKMLLRGSAYSVRKKSNRSKSGFASADNSSILINRCIVKTAPAIPIKVKIISCTKYCFCNIKENKV